MAVSHEARFELKNESGICYLTVLTQLLIEQTSGNARGFDHEETVAKDGTESCSGSLCV